MLTGDETASLVQSVNDDVFDAQIVDQNGGGDDVNDGIDRADFVKMDFLHRAAVGFGFGLGDDLKDFFRQIARRGGDVRMVDDVENVGQMAVFVRVMIVAMVVIVIVVVVVVVVMVMIVVMFRARQPHVEIQPRNAVGRFAFDRPVEFPRGQAGQSGFQLFDARPQIQQSRDGHVAADAAFAFQIQIFGHL